MQDKYFGLLDDFKCVLITWQASSVKLEHKGSIDWISALHNDKSLDEPHFSLRKSRVVMKKIIFTAWIVPSSAFENICVKYDFSNKSVNLLVYGGWEEVWRRHHNKPTLREYPRLVHDVISLIHSFQLSCYI